MDTKLETLHQLPPYLAPIDLAEKARPFLSELKYLTKRLRKANKRARKNPDEKSLVWQIESEIRDLLKKYSSSGIKRITKEELERRLQGWEAEEEALEDEVSVWDDLAVGSVVGQFRTQAIEQASTALDNPYRDNAFEKMLQSFRGKQPKWDQVEKALLYAARAQRLQQRDLHRMFENVTKNKTPHELDAWVNSIEAVTEFKDDPYESIRESSFWMSEGLALVGFWAQKHLWERTERQTTTRKLLYLFLELILASGIIFLSLIPDFSSISVKIARGIAMPFIACLPYIAYVSFRIREVTGGRPVDLGKVTWNFRIFYGMQMIMMIGPYIVHRWLPRRINKYLQIRGREQRLRKALDVYVEALRRGEQKGHMLAEMLKARHELNALRHRFELVPLTVMSDYSGDERYVVIDLVAASEQGCTQWLREEKVDEEKSEAEASE